MVSSKACRVLRVKVTILDEVSRVREVEAVGAIARAKKDGNTGIDDGLSRPRKRRGLTKKHKAENAHRSAWLVREVEGLRNGATSSPSCWSQ